jgi:hypothetical protein
LPRVSVMPIVASLSHFGGGGGGGTTGALVVTTTFASSAWAVDGLRTTARSADAAKQERRTMLVGEVDLNRIICFGQVYYCSSKRAANRLPAETPPD